MAGKEMAAAAARNAADLALAGNLKVFAVINLEVSWE